MMKLIYDHPDQDLLVISSEGGMHDPLRMTVVEDLYARIDRGLRKIIVDCSRLEYISSLDLGVLARVRSRIVEHGGDIKLCAVSGMVREVLGITRLDQLFEIYPDLESARRAFDGAA